MKNAASLMNLVYISAKIALVAYFFQDIVAIIF